VTIQHASYETLTVPTLNASFVSLKIYKVFIAGWTLTMASRQMGNGSGVAANANSLITLSPDPENGPPEDGFTTG
jgi:hypothetical protein